MVLFYLLVSFPRPGKLLGPNSGPWWCRTWASLWPPFSASRLVSGNFKHRFLETWENWMVRAGEIMGNWMVRVFIFYHCVPLCFFVSNNITQR